MKHTRILARMIVVGLTAALPYSVSAVEQREDQPADHTNTAPTVVSPTPPATQPGTSSSGNNRVSNNPVATAITLLYKPPLGLGAPTGLVAGGSRGTHTCRSSDAGNENTVLTLSVLAPADHIGLTVHEQPSLYWYLSAPAGCQVEVTLTDEQAVEPLLDLNLNPPLKPGVQQVRLADHGVRLTPGVQYQWAVALVPDSEHRSKDIIAASRIERIAATEALRTNLARADKAAVPAVYAEAGLWYDAVAAISDLITDVPQNPALRMQRAALLEQVQLADVVEYERKLSYQQNRLGQ